MNYVVSFGTPRDIVGVAEGVDLKRANIGWKEEEVLQGGSEHVPWVEVEEGHQKVDSNRGCHGDDEVRENVIADCEVFGFEDLADDDVETGENVVGHDDRVNYHRSHVNPLCTLRSISH